MKKRIQYNLAIFGKTEGYLVLIFILNQLLERLGIYVPFVHSYLDDLIAVPITLAITRFIMYYLHRPTYETLFTPFHLVSVVFMFSIYFEWYLPSRYAFHHRDYFDVVCYAFGGLFYYALLRTRLRSVAERESFLRKIPQQGR
ncbi:MAG: hypothetical protein ACK4KT_03105 [Thermaurantimonas sp.]